MKNQIVLNFLKSRISCPPTIMSPNSPNNEEWNEIFEAVSSVADHGSLMPYRFIVLEKEEKEKFANFMKNLKVQSNPSKENEIEQKFQKTNPNIGSYVIAYCVFNPKTKISQTDQEYVSVCAATQLTLSIIAAGYSCIWYTLKYKSKMKEYFKIEDENIQFIGFFPVGKYNESKVKKRPALESFVQFFK